ncbi:MAG: glycosyltransferase family 39 protein, partial [Candidatus Hydrogenedentota bacterium]
MSEDTYRIGSLAVDRREVPSACAAAACLLAIALATSYNLRAKSFWYDEAISAYYAQQSFLVIAKMSLLDYVPPLYYWLLKVYSTIFGHADWVLRSFSVLFNLAAAVYVWKLVRMHFDRRTSLYTLILFGVSNYLLVRAQTARPYPLFLFFTIASIYYFYRAIGDGKKRWWPLYSLCLLCSLFTLYLAVATIAALLVLMLWSAATKPSRWNLNHLFWTGIAVLGFLPWAILFKMKHPSTNPDWYGETVPSGHLWRDFLGLFKHFFETGLVRHFARGHGGSLPVILFLFFIGLICIYSLVAWRKNDGAIRMLLFTCVYFLISGFVNYLLNIFAGVEFATASRFVFLCPFAYMVAAAGVSRVTSKILQAVFLITLIFPNVVAMRQTFASPSIEDWRGVARYVEDNWRDDDLIIFSPGYMNIAFDYYAEGEHRELGYPKGLMDPARMYWGYHYLRG